MNEPILSESFPCRGASAAWALPCRAYGKRLLWTVWLLLFLGPVLTYAQEDKWDQLFSKADALYKQGDYQGATSVAEEALKVAESTFPPDHPKLSTSFNSLAFLYLAQKRYGDAETLLQRSLKIKEAHYGTDDPHLIFAINSLASVFEKQQQYDQAEAYRKRALAIGEKFSAQDAVDLRMLLENLAGLYFAQNRFAEAESLFQRDLNLREQQAGHESPDLVPALKLLVLTLKNERKFSAAEPLSLRILKIEEASTGENSDKVASDLNNLGLLYQNEKRYREAEPLLERALRILQASSVASPSDVASAQINLAALYADENKIPAAKHLYEDALQRLAKTPNPDPDVLKDAQDGLTSIAQRRANVGNQLNPGQADLIKEAEELDDQIDRLGQQGRETEALLPAQRSLEIKEKAFGPNHPDVAASLTTLGGIYTSRGEYAKAEALFHRALTIYDGMGEGENPVTALLLNQFGLMYDMAGAYAKAEPLLQRALAIDLKTVGPDHPDTARMLNALGKLYQDSGEYTKAEPLLQRALAIREKDEPGSFDTAVSLNNLAAFYFVTGALDKAEPLYERALVIDEKVLGPDNRYTGATANSLGSLYEARGNFEKAAQFFQRALSVREKALGPEHPETAISLESLALMYHLTGDYAKAEPLYERAAAIYEKALGPDHPETANALGNLAALYVSTGRYDKAEPLDQRVVAIYEKVLGPEHPKLAASLNSLARLYTETGAYAKAEPLYERAQIIEENNTARFLLAGSEARKLEYLQERDGSVAEDVSLALADPGSRSAAIGLTSVLQYKGRVLDAMSNSVARLRQGATPEDRGLLDRLSEVAQEFSSLSFSGPGSLTAEAYRQHLDELAARQEKLESDLATRSAGLRDAARPVTLEAVRQALPGDAVLVEWFLYSSYDRKGTKYARGVPRYVAFVLKHMGEPVTIDLGAAQPIEDLVTEFRTALADPTSTYYKDVAQDLYAKLIRPLYPHLSQGGKLLLSPDAALNLVPFAALVDEHGDYLVQHFEITYLTSGRDLLRIASEAPARSGAMVVANPDYGAKASAATIVDASLQPPHPPDHDRGTMVFPPLPGTAVEASALKSLLKLDDRSVLTGDRATKANLRQLHGPRILHVATHGFFLSNQQAAEVAVQVLQSSGFKGSGRIPMPGENPLLRSGLALAGANAKHSAGSDDGILTAAEAAQLDLEGTQLVVLSACETGLGSVNTSEGVYGLRRALVLAGAQAQLISLWKVADTATQELMLDYYKRLLNGEGRASALRDSQKAMMAMPERSHPYYWAAFIPIGNWAPLGEQKRVAEPPTEMTRSGGVNER